LPWPFIIIDENNSAAHQYFLENLPHKQKRPSQIQRSLAAPPEFIYKQPVF
jgi:hypothetical protein